MSQNEGWASTGFDAMDEQEEWESSGGGSGGSNTLTYWTPWVEPEKGGPVTKLILLLDDAPFSFWEHGLYTFGKKSSEKAICLKRNRIADTCPICDIHNKQVAKDLRAWPSFVGYLTVIDCGEIKFGSAEDENERVVIDRISGWDNGKKGQEHRVWQFGKKIMPLKKGGQDKPGLLAKLRRLKERKGGSLVGTLWAVTRTASKEEVVGTEWEYRGRVDVSSSEALKNALVQLPGSPLTSTDDPMIRDLTNEPVNYSKVFVPKSASEMMSWLGIRDDSKHENGGGGRGSDRGGSGGGGSQDMDDDVPF